MTIEFIRLEEGRIKLADKLKRIFPQYRRGGYRDIASEQWDGRSFSSEPNDEAMALIKKLQSSYVEPE